MTDCRAARELEHHASTHNMGSDHVSYSRKSIEPSHIIVAETTEVLIYSGVAHQQANHIVNVNFTRQL